MNIKAVLKKNTMIIVLVLVYLFFMVTTKGSIFFPLNFNALITQNAYVYILACGMLMCMLTKHRPVLRIRRLPTRRDCRLLHGYPGDEYRSFGFPDPRDRRWLRLCPGLPDRLCQYPAVDCHPCRLSCLPRTRNRDSEREQFDRFDRSVPGQLSEHFFRKAFPDQAQ